MSIARWFVDIVGDGHLQPRTCSVFDERVLYLTYGGTSYRTRTGTTKNAAELPIALMFGPSTSHTASRFYPFDTGAMAHGRFGTWTESFTGFRETLRVEPRDREETPALMVHHLYSGNGNYLAGSPDPQCLNKPQPLPTLARFITDDLTLSGVDKRQATIECHFTRALQLNSSLMWIGFPECQFDVFSTLCHKIQWVPEYYAYKSHAVFNPAEIEAQLEHEAMKIIRRFTLE